jgi:ankyrin repeat protein
MEKMICALHLACKEGDAAKADSLINQGSLHNKNNIVNARDSEGRSALHFACEYGQAHIVHMLFEAGTDPTYRSKNGKTSLDLVFNRSKFDQGRGKIVRLFNKYFPELIIEKFLEPRKNKSPESSVKQNRQQTWGLLPSSCSMKGCRFELAHKAKIDTANKLFPDCNCPRLYLT